MIAPVFKQLSQDHDDVVFLKVDVDQNPDTATHYNVSAMPTFVSRTGLFGRPYSRSLNDDSFVPEM